MMIVVMGVSGSGKTTIGEMLAEQLSLPFYDADDFHPKSNVDKMSNGLPLNDQDRAPWLEVLTKHMSDWAQESGAVLACSALKQKYRDQLNTANAHVQWVYLEGSYQLIKNRLDDRGAHFMDSELLKSQFDALEEPTHAINVSISKPPELIIETIIQKLQ